MVQESYEMTKKIPLVYALIIFFVASGKGIIVFTVMIIDPRNLPHFFII